jgi:hypothetical protein
MPNIWSLWLSAPQGRATNRSRHEQALDMVGSGASGWTRGDEMTGGSTPLPSPPIALPLYPRQRWCRRRRLYLFFGRRRMVGADTVSFAFASLGKNP